MEASNNDEGMIKTKSKRKSIVGRADCESRPSDGALNGISDKRGHFVSEMDE